MATRTCPSCGAKYTHLVSICAECEVPLVSADGTPVLVEEATPPVVVEVVGDEPTGGAGGGDVTYSYEDLTEDEFSLFEGGEEADDAELAAEMTDGGEDLDVVALEGAQRDDEDDEDVDDEDLDELDLGLDDDDLEGLEDLDDDGPSAQDALSGLYVAADILQHKPRDPGAANDLRAALTLAESLALPYGFEPMDWERLLRSARETVEAIDAVDATDQRSVNAGAAAARRLRETLHPLV